VHQNELFFAHMTVREHLSFHAINRNGGAKSHAECEAMVDAVIEEMGLGHAADTLIGGGFLYYTKGGWVHARRPNIECHPGVCH
jgi:uncharacterized protein YcbK (DUF882 family)